MLKATHQCNKQNSGLDLTTTLNLDVNEDPEGEPEDEEDFESDMIMRKVDNQKHLGQVCAKDLQIIGEWQEYIFCMENEMPNL